MSLVPLLFSDWLGDSDHPHTLFDQHFGLPMNPEDIIEHSREPSRFELLPFRPSRLRLRSSRYHPFLHTGKRSGKEISTTLADKDKFSVTLDVQQFRPDEIKVKVVDNTVVVEAKHEEKKDEHGWISRQFVRKYQIPDEFNIEKVESHLSSDGVLNIISPKKESLKENSKEKVIQIQLTGEPAVIHRENAAVENGSTSRQSNDQRPAARPARKSTVKAA